jgi:polar amino acid transport system substrate-binding protein
LRATKILLAGVCLGLFLREAGAQECDTIVLTGHPNYPPIIWTQSNALDGLPVRIFQKLGRDSGTKVDVLHPGSWAEALEAVRTGRADAVAGVALTEDRKRWLEIVSPPYLDNSISVVVARARPFSFARREDLVGKKGAANKAESFGDELDRFVAEQLSVTRTDGAPNAIDALLAGKVDYVIAGTYPAIGIALAKGARDQITILQPPLITSPTFLAFSKKSPCRKLAQAFGKSIEKMRASGEIRHMEQKAISDWYALRRNE